MMKLLLQTEYPIIFSLRFNAIDNGICFKGRCRVRCQTVTLAVVRHILGNHRQCIVFRKLTSKGESFVSCSEQCTLLPFFVMRDRMLDLSCWTLVKTSTSQLVDLVLVSDGRAKQHNKTLPTTSCLCPTQWPREWKRNASMRGSKTWRCCKSCLKVIQLRWKVFDYIVRCHSSRAMMLSTHLGSACWKIPEWPHTTGLRSKNGEHFPEGKFCHSFAFNAQWLPEFGVKIELCMHWLR